MDSSVLTEIVNNVGFIRLNRPKVLNSLNVEMVKIIYEQLQNWQEDPEVAFVCITGEGKKGLCAGGDMRAFYDLKDKNGKEVAAEFFSIEYQMDLMIHRYSKPVLVYMDGIVMGGGVGLSIGGSHRIVTENTKWAMPEMNIGFFPDVGASYFLNQMPGCTGRYLALTSSIMKAEDVLYTGAADYYISSADWPALISEILSKKWTLLGAKTELNNLIEKYYKPCEMNLSSLSFSQEKIKQHFQFDTMEKILASIDYSITMDNDDHWAKEVKEILLSKSPISLKVTLIQLLEGKEKTLADCFKMEFALSMNFMDNDDFYEGVRSVLVDKDRSPKWRYPSLDKLGMGDILSYFRWDRNEEVFIALDKLDDKTIHKF
ncbi:enoyl-CoA hydratase/isomerase family protein [Bacillus sp. EB106-08-02-XG196]|uniref:enoyl-CoA hydratase/isomerase family protein n=1 Tax=Bacillus sp. EB106-08-02-XG196 TaxID=2737049 RepID=UPI0015C48FA6|nr:enoyl-CoA hydratase/isomerase family protein [Bacillus sp. EB106-08-02-XG196]